MFRRLSGKMRAAEQIIRGRLLPSFSQAGEDRIIHFFFSHYLRKEKVTYIDIGAHHPYRFNNTYLFYSRGGRGVCIEPDIRFSALLKKYRKDDVILCAGIGFSGKTENADFFMFPRKYSTWNTFSKAEAEERMREMGIKYEVKKQLLLDLNTTIEEHFSDTLDILSVDAEGLDFKIVLSLNFEKHSPNVICVESIPYRKSGESRNGEISDFLLEKGYIQFAHTHINSIYVRRSCLE